MLKLYKMLNKEKLQAVRSVEEAAIITVEQTTTEQETPYAAIY